MRFGVLEESVHGVKMLFWAILFDEIFLFRLRLLVFNRCNNIPTVGVAGHGGVVSFLSSHGEAASDE